MTPELTRLLIVILIGATFLWSIAATTMVLIFGYPSRVPTPPLPPRRAEMADR